MRQSREPAGIEKAKLERNLGVLGWALFFVWLGIAFLVGIEVGLALIGVGIITLGIQLVRRRANLELEGFWVIVGALFTMGGLLSLFTPDIPALPVLLIAAGAMLLASLLLSRRHA